MQRFIDTLAGCLSGMLIGVVLMASVTTTRPFDTPRQAAALSELPQPTGTRPAATASPRTSNPPGATIHGTASFMHPSYGARYLALPGGAGLVVRICAGDRCIVRRSTDAGPSLRMQREHGRIADLSFDDFRTLCACDPWAVGLIRVTVSPAKVPAPPETSTEG